MLPFEQSSTSPFGQNNSSNNPFSPKPFGSTTPFGSQTDSSVSGGTSTGVFGAAHTPSPFGASCSPAFGSSMHGSSSTSAFDSSSTSFGGFGQKLAFGGIGIPTSFQKQLEAARKQVEPLKKQQLEAVRIRMQQLQAVRIRKQLEAVDATSTLAIGATRNPAIPMSPTSFPAFVSDNWNDVFSIFSYPTIAEEYGGTSGQTATLESISAKRFESCFAIAGADYCVFAADVPRDHPKISKLSEKSVMTYCCFQADVKALQEVLSAENLTYERQHNKPMSRPEMLRLYCDYRKLHRDYVYIVLGGLDSEGKGWIFTDFGYRAAAYCGHRAVASRVGYSSQDSGHTICSEYKLPAKDVIAQLSETEAVHLAKTVFKSATHTGDKLEIVVLNASGVRRAYTDLRKDCDGNVSKKDEKMLHKVY